MRKRLVGILLAVVLVLGLCPASFAAGGIDNFKKTRTYTEGQFTDVPSTAWYANSVALAYELGLVNGNSATTFNPDGNITLAETLTLACRLHSTYYNNGHQFTSTSPWYKAYVDYAVTNGIIVRGAYLDYTVKATRADFVTILAAALPAEALPAINTLGDWDIPDIYYEKNALYNAVYLMYRAGILTGSDSYGTFYPDSNIARKEVAAIVVRMADISQRRTFTLAEPPYPSVEAMQGVWRAEGAWGAVELVFNGNYFTLTYKDNYTYADTGVTEYGFFHGVTSETLRQRITKWSDDETLENNVNNDPLYITSRGNLIFVARDGSDDDYGYFLYKTDSATLIHEVRNVIGEENILAADQLKASAITSIRMNDITAEVSAWNGGSAGLYYVREMQCYATIGGKECRMSDSMLNWTSSAPHVAAKKTGYEDYLAVFSNGATMITAEYNGMTASILVNVVNCVPVHYIANREVLDYDGYHAFVYSLLDENENYLIRNCRVQMRIVNDNGEVVYEKTHTVTAEDFLAWTYYGQELPLGTIYIFDEEIIPGTTTEGTLYYRVEDLYEGTFFWFEEYALRIHDLPLK